MEGPGRMITAEPWAALPDDYRVSGQPSEWIAANKPGEDLGSFLEGPSFDAEGNLYLVDIPYGRIFRVAPDGGWHLVADYDGWPNGLKFDRRGRICVADYRLGILALDPVSGTLEPIYASNRSESFRGCNDLFFAGDGTLFFTDQGQTGLHDRSGRVYRADPDGGALQVLIDTAPSPNGLVADLEERALLVAMTRGAEVWRLPLFPGGTAKVGLFARMPGGVSGPDGMALDAEGNLYVCHAGLGTVFAFTPLGEPLLRVDCRAIGLATTNLAFGGADRRDLFITVSDAGVVARARMETPGKPMAFP